MEGIEIKNQSWMIIEKSNMKALSYKKISIQKMLMSKSFGCWDMDGSRMNEWHVLVSCESNKKYYKNYIYYSN